MELRSETVEKRNLAGVEWDESHFKFCEFRDFSIDGQIICSDFVTCSFTNVDWYWGLFSASNFIDCRFSGCIFRGCGFPDSRFVDCKFTNCRFIEDNLGGPCDFTKAISYGCTMTDTEGFMFRA